MNRPAMLASRATTLLFGCAVSISVSAQTASVPGGVAIAALPDSPGAFAFRAPLRSLAPDPSASDSVEQATTGPQAGPTAPAPVYAHRLSSKIAPGFVAQPLSASDKFEMSITRQLTLGTLAATAFSAGYNHLLDNRPHYGTDSAGFGERLGASALRSTTQSIFNFGVYSNLFHDDPRYYVLGPQYPIKKRAIYAATRVIFTRKNSGERAINYPYLAAVASAAALTNAYYPDRDRAVGRTVSGVFTTIGLNAGVMQLNEFGGDIKRRFFHKH